MALTPATASTSRCCRGVAELNLAGFYDLASALGTVPMCLNHPVSDDYSGANFPAGRQQFNASQALSFVRQRHGLTNGDLDHMHRQQALLTWVASKLRGSRTLTSTSKLRGLITGTGRGHRLRRYPHNLCDPQGMNRSVPGL